MVEGTKAFGPGMGKGSGTTNPTGVEVGEGGGGCVEIGVGEGVRVGEGVWRGTGVALGVARGVDGGRDGTTCPHFVRLCSGTPRGNRRIASRFLTALNPEVGMLEYWNGGSREGEVCDIPAFQYSMTPAPRHYRAKPESH